MKIFMPNRHDSQATSRNLYHRRAFVNTIAKAACAIPFLPMPFASTSESEKFSKNALTIQNVIDLFLKEIEGTPFANTVDTIKSGDASNVVSGIVTTMFATTAIVEKTIEAGANFIIAHEPTFYNHLDATDWLVDNEVFNHKKELLDKNNITVWRCHDSIHRHKPDGVLTGVIEALGWERYQNPDESHLLTLPACPLEQIIEHVKNKLNIPALKYIGSTRQMCARIALMPGAAGGTAQISALQKLKPDVMLCGEINEWETAEYIRDLQQMGHNTSLIILGHSVSEEAGMEWMASWLKNKFSYLNITHILSGDPFEWSGN